MEYADGGDLCKLIKDKRNSKEFFNEEEIWK